MAKKNGKKKCQKKMAKKNRKKKWQNINEI